jgi:hypothetical protein
MSVRPDAGARRNAHLAGEALQLSTAQAHFAVLVARHIGQNRSTVDADDGELGDGVLPVLHIGPHLPPPTRVTPRS